METEQQHYTTMPLKIFQFFWLKLVAKRQAAVAVVRLNLGYISRLVSCEKNLITKCVITALCDAISKVGF